MAEQLSWSKRQAISTTKELTKIGKPLRDFFTSLGDPSQDSEVAYDEICARLDWFLVAELQWEARYNSSLQEKKEYKIKEDNATNSEASIKNEIPQLKTDLLGAQEEMRRHLNYTDILEKINEFPSQAQSQKLIEQETSTLNSLQEESNKLNYMFNQRKKQCLALFTSIHELEEKIQKPIEIEETNLLTTESLESIDAEVLKQNLIKMIQNDESLNHLPSKLLAGTSHGMEAEFASGGLSDILNELGNLDAMDVDG